jgi:hypothetical protein
MPGARTPTILPCCSPCSPSRLLAHDGRRWGRTRRRSSTDHPTNLELWRDPRPDQGRQRAHVQSRYDEPVLQTCQYLPMEEYIEEVVIGAGEELFNFVSCLISYLPFSIFETSWGGLLRSEEGRSKRSFAIKVPSRCHRMQGQAPYYNSLSL